MNQKIYLLGGILSACLAVNAQAQSAQQPGGSMYIDYPQLLTGILRKADTLLRTGPKQPTGADLRILAARLTDEAPPAEPLRPATPGARVLSDENIYSKRKNSVLTVCRLRRNPAAPADLNFDFIGTAFPISENGICVTNYHVFKNLFGDQKAADSTDGVYCVTTLDGQVYFVDRLMAYSQNNDLAVFHVATNGVKLAPVPLGTPAPVGTPVYCISHPQTFFYYFSKGIVARNVAVPREQTVAGYNSAGRPPIRMDITADYGVGSSGAPILDKYGNLAGIVSSTVPIVANVDGPGGMVFTQQQMVVKMTTPVKALLDLLRR